MRSFCAATAVGFALVVAFAASSRAEDAAAPAADTAQPAAPGKIGPGAAPGKVQPGKAAPVASGIQIARKTTVSSAVNVHDKVLKECNIETMLPQMIADRSPEVQLVDSMGGGTRLELKIIDIHAPSGGFFSGPKWITVEGRLSSGKTVKGNFIAKETSMASATACGMLHKVMLVLAGDIATWLHDPSKGAKLGSAR